jgi:hypothetical protein
MSASNDFESDILKLVFQNIAAANFGDVAGLPPSATTGNLFVALHTADPGEAGNQGTSETTYTGYARQAVARSAAGWTLSGTAPTQVANAAVITFPASTVGTPTITHFSIGTASTGAGKIVVSGALTSAVTIVLSQPNPWAIGALVATCD